jgi:hypothetical protein
MIMRTRFVLALTVAALLVGQPGFAQTYNDFTLIDVPCASGAPTFCPDGVAVQTVVNGINARGDIVGLFVDGTRRQHGFVRTAGRYVTIDVPGELAGVNGITFPTTVNGINPAGELVGSYTVTVTNESAPLDSPAYCPAASPAACIKGFLYRQGRFYSVLYPNHPGAIPQRITPNGDIYGCLHDNDLGMSMFGAVWTRHGGANLTAGGGELSDDAASVPMSMNNGATPGGEVVIGLWNDMGGRHGYIVDHGTFQSYDVQSPTIRVTVIWDINPQGQFVGTYVDATGRHGFLQNPDGSAAIQIDVPGRTNTIVLGINPEGAIVGSYSIGATSHGFVAMPNREGIQ